MGPRPEPERRPTWQGEARRIGTSGAGHATGPDEHFAVFIHRQLFGIDEIIFEVFQERIIELQLAFEDPIGDTLLPLEEGKDLCQNGIVVHHRPSTCASAASVSGSQKVISMAWYMVDGR